MAAVKPGTYCNPLAVPNLRSGEGGSRRFGSLADPTVVRHDGRYYLFVTGSQAWTSDDLVTWERRTVELPARVIGPSLVGHAGVFYLSGNGGIGLWTARHPLGPWTNSGEILDHEGRKVHWADLMFFVDDDGTFYCYHHSGSGVGADGLFVDVLEPGAGYLRSAGPSVPCFGYDPEHVWERWGGSNEHSDVAWIESPWMTKRNGTYFLQYSGSGTEWTTYAIGVYTSASPLGPWTYDPGSPILADAKGLVRGPGHHCVIDGPDGNPWVVYHALFRNAGKFDRRLCLDRVVFDERGRMRMIAPTETPQWGPDSGRTGDRGRLPLSIDKEITASSSAPGRDARYANDHSVRTWWQPEAGDREPWLAVDLAARFSVGGIRVILGDGPRMEGEIRYRLEVSDDGRTWRPVAERAPASDCDYTELDGVGASRVRLVFMEPGPEAVPGVVELTVFGEP